MILINSATIKKLLDRKTSIELMADAMKAFSNSTTIAPARGKYPVNHEGAIMLVMPAAAESLGVYAVKLVNQHSQNAALGLPTFQGTIIVFDYHNGTPLGMLDAATITALRTSAVSALATQALANKTASSHGILGTGVQATEHLFAIGHVRNISHVQIWNRNLDKAQAFVKQHQPAVSAKLSATDSVEQACNNDIVSAVTASTEPVILHQFIQPGTHINLVGAHTPDTREIDSQSILDSKVYVDSKEAACREAGEIMIPLSESPTFNQDKLTELGELLLGQQTGRDDSQQITIFKSLGLAVQDLYTAAYILKQAQQQALGQSFSLTE